jgi:GT2 family glycosyltransferase
MTRFSVIIPTFNRKAYLLECLETVFGQSYAPHEVIVIDDGSTDGTVEALSAFGGRVQVMQQANAGPGAARNRGAQAATGDYLAFLDSDDLWFPWTLGAFSALISRHNNPSLLFGRFVDFTEPDELGQIVWEQPSGSGYPDFLSSHSKGYFCGAGMMVIRRSAFVETLGFEEDFLNAEDHDLALQLGEASGFVSVTRPVTVGHRLHGSNEMTDTGKSLNGLRRLVRKEKAHLYPGGQDRGHARKAIISKHVRSAVLSAFKTGHVADARRLYIDTFGWNLRLGRGAYLFAAPLLAAANTVRLGR